MKLVTWAEVILGGRIWLDVRIAQILMMRSLLICWLVLHLEGLY